MKKLCLLAISYNEEKHIKFWIDNHREYVDEIILVDTGSTDKTVEIAKENGVKIFTYLWEHDFKRAKNFALRCCSIACHPDWVFFLSPDYWVSNSDMKTIREAIEIDDFDAYRTRTMYHNKGWFDLEDIRIVDEPPIGGIVLFKDDPYTFYTGKIDETVDSSLIVCGKKVGYLEVMRHHDSSENNEDRNKYYNVQYYNILQQMWNLEDALNIALNSIRKALR